MHEQKQVTHQLYSTSQYFAAQLQPMQVSRAPRSPVCQTNVTNVYN